MEIIINQIANLVLTLSGTVFFLMLFGKHSSVVHRYHYMGHWLLKLGLSAFIAGSLFCFLNASEVPTTQVLSNVGLASIFTWVTLNFYQNETN